MTVSCAHAVEVGPGWDSKQAREVILDQRLEHAEAANRPDTVTDQYYGFTVQTGFRWAYYVGTSFHSEVRVTPDGYLVHAVGAVEVPEPGPKTVSVKVRTYDLRKTDFAGIEEVQLVTSGEQWLFAVVFLGLYCPYQQTHIEVVLKDGSRHTRRMEHREAVDFYRMTFPGWWWPRSLKDRCPKLYRLGEAYAWMAQQARQRGGGESEPAVAPAAP
jgi:hypothetical protein